MHDIPLCVFCFQNEDWWGGLSASPCSSLLFPPRCLAPFPLTLSFRDSSRSPAEASWHRYLVSHSWLPFPLLIGSKQQCCLGTLHGVGTYFYPGIKAEQQHMIKDDASHGVMKGAQISRWQVRAVHTANWRCISPQYQAVSHRQRAYLSSGV